MIFSSFYSLISSRKTLISLNIDNICCETLHTLAAVNASWHVTDCSCVFTAHSMASVTSGQHDRVFLSCARVQNNMLWSALLHHILGVSHKVVTFDWYWTKTEFSWECLVLSPSIRFCQIPFDSSEMKRRSEWTDRYYIPFVHSLCTFCSVRA